MRFTRLTYPLLLCILCLGACKKYNGEEAARQRQDWMQSLKDSIAAISAQRSADSLRLDDLRNRLAEDISAFSEVNNPREVEPYYILKAFRSQYPLTSTGIAARMMKNEQLELIAALKGARFNAIRVSAGGQSAQSPVVPADQALNYTAAGLTTVAFTGAQADSVAMLVSAAMDQPVILEYLNNGSTVSRLTLSQSQKDWVGKTWDVCGNHMEARRLEKQSMLDSRKIEILKITLSQKESETQHN